MKKYLFTILAAFSFQSTYSQLAQSTVGQIYNFSVGDTFECHCQFQNSSDDCSQNNNFMYIILSRHDIGDSVYYTIKQDYIYGGPGYCPYSRYGSYTSNVIYGPKDSAIFWYHGHRALGCDTLQNCFDDTVYIDTSMQNNRRVNEHKESGSGVAVNDTSFADGLGEIYNWVANEDISMPWGGCQLIYYHKAGQQPWGSPVYFLISAIHEISNQPVITLFPNPATSTLIVRPVIDPVLKVQCFDVAGRICNFSYTVSNGTVEADISLLTPGIYFLQINNQQFKFVKQ